MILIKDKTTCCGCGGCAQICPKKCISLEIDEEGFWYPLVHEEECINCKLCEQVCPILNKNNHKYRSKLDAYVAYHNNLEVRMESSSGGIFSGLAAKILDENGTVYGAAFDSDLMVRHIKIQRHSELYKIRGSKYLQSVIGTTFEEVKKDLQEGKTVLYSGTACQIAGLRSFLKKDYPQLYTVDVLCHGVPSPKLWKKYLDDQQEKHGASVSKSLFRDKKYGWKSYAVSLTFANDMVYESVFHKDAFMQMFLRNISLRPSCYSCEFKDMNRPSDITLGDCWGIENSFPAMDDNRGTSIIAVHTSKGKALLESISSDISIVPAELDKILPPNSDSRKSAPRHPKRKQFFELLVADVPFDRLSDLVKISYATKIKKWIKGIIYRVKRKIKYFCKIK